MNLTANSTRGRISGLAPRGNLAVVQKSLLQYRTTRIERVLLIAMVMILTLGAYFPSVAGLSASFIIFMICGGYVLFKRPRILARISSDSLFVTAYILLALASLIEFLHPYANY